LIHEANPMKDDNVKDLITSIKDQKPDMGIAFDGDGDRIFFFDGDGDRIPIHAVASLVAEQFLKNKGPASFVAPERMPKIFEETIVTHGGTLQRSRVGHSFIKKVMRKYDAVFGGETSGHFYFRDMFYVDSGIFMLVTVLHIIEHEKKSLSELAKPYIKRFQSGELSFRVEEMQKAIKKLEKEFSDGKQSKLDGLSVYYDNWWFNIRLSNTEPLLRVNIEADTQELLANAKGHIEKIISA